MVSLASLTALLVAWAANGIDWRLFVAGWALLSVIVSTWSGWQYGRRIRAERDYAALMGFGE
jgi:hypothetical protein